MLPTTLDILVGTSVTSMTTLGQYQQERDICPLYGRLPLWCHLFTTLYNKSPWSSIKTQPLPTGLHFAKVEDELH